MKLFQGTIRILLWAEGLIHQHLDADQILFLVLGYDWCLFGYERERKERKNESNENEKEREKRKNSETTKWKMTMQKKQNGTTNPDSFFFL